MEVSLGELFDGLANGKVMSESDYEGKKQEMVQINSKFEQYFNNEIRDNIVVVDQIKIF